MTITENGLFKKSKVPTMNIQSLVVNICASFTLKNKIYYVHYNMYQIPECHMENLLRLRRQD